MNSTQRLMEVARKAVMTVSDAEVEGINRTIQTLLSSNQIEAANLLTEQRDHILKSEAEVLMLLKIRSD